MHPSQDIVDFLDSVKQGIFNGDESKINYKLAAWQSIWDYIDMMPNNADLDIRDIVANLQAGLSKQPTWRLPSSIQKSCKIQIAFFDEILRGLQNQPQEPSQAQIDPFEFLDQIRQNCSGDMATLTAVWMIEEILNTSNVPSMIDVANWCEKLAEDLDERYQTLWASTGNIKGHIIDALGTIKGEWLSKQVQVNELNKVKPNKFEYVFEERRGKGQPHQIWLNHRFVIGFFDEDECKETLHNMNNAIESAN